MIHGKSNQQLILFLLKIMVQTMQWIQKVIKQKFRLITKQIKLFENVLNHFLIDIKIIWKHQCKVVILPLITFIHSFFLFIYLFIFFSTIQGAYIKYLGVGQEGLETQGSIELNISWTSNFVKKYFMAPFMNFTFLF